MKLNRPERPDRGDRSSLCLSVSSSASFRVFCRAKQGGQDG
jgi:hypothetical protein